jgi:hypothetical protein
VIGALEDDTEAEIADVWADDDGTTAARTVPAAPAVAAPIHVQADFKTRVFHPGWVSSRFGVEVACAGVTDSAPSLAVGLPGSCFSLVKGFCAAFVLEVSLAVAPCCLRRFLLFGMVTLA